MPKGGLHHIHTTAAPSADFYVKLTYNDCVYFNEREKLFKVVPVSGLCFLNFKERLRWRRVHQEHRDAQVLSLTRGIWSKTKGLHQDDSIRVREPRITRDMDSLPAQVHSNQWWVFKNNLLLDLGKYKEFFKLILEEILTKCFNQKIYVVELRHISGLLFDDDRV